MIYLCTTFREFDGSKNDAIQRLFLESIKKQTVQNYKLIITTFNEKTVADVIKSEFPEKSKIINIELVNYRFSLTDVLLNGIDESMHELNSIVLWCTCDIIFASNFFEVIESINAPDLTGIYHPNYITDSIASFYAKDFKCESLVEGIDIVFFNNTLFTNKKNYEYIKNYRFYNWGMFEHFLAGCCKEMTKNRKNIFLITNLIKISNDRTVNNENKTWFSDCTKLNTPVLESFIKNETYPRARMLRHLYYCHKIYRYVTKIGKKRLSFKDIECTKIKIILTRFIWEARLVLWEAKRVVKELLEESRFSFFRKLFKILKKINRILHRILHGGP